MCVTLNLMKHTHSLFCCAGSAPSFGFVSLKRSFVSCLVVSIHSWAFSGRNSTAEILNAQRGKISIACFSEHLVLFGSSSWRPWQSGAGRSSPGPPRPPDPWRCSSSLVRSHKKHLNAVAERQRHSGRPDMRVCVWQVCMPYVYMNTYKHIYLLLTIWAVSSAAYLTPRIDRQRRGGKLKAVCYLKQSTWELHCNYEHLHNIIFLNIWEKVI